MANTPVPIEGANTIVGYEVTMPFTTDDNYVFSFPYLESTDIQIVVKGVTALVSEDFEFVSDFLIKLTTVGVDKLNALYGLETGAVPFLIRRRTELTERKVDFQEGATLTEKDLDLNANQAFYLIQEVYDSSELGNISFDPVGGSLDMQNSELINVEEPTAYNSASTLTTVLNNAVTPQYAENAEYRSGRLVFSGNDLYRANKDVFPAPAVFPSADFDLVLSAQNIADITGSVTVHSDVSDVGSGAIITPAERNDLHTHSNKTILDNTTASFTTAEETKLSNIENNATADQTGAEIKSAYEIEANAYTDAKDTKLTSIETNAKDDQNASEVPFTTTTDIIATNTRDAIEEVKGIASAGTDDQTADEVPFTTTTDLVSTDTKSAIEEVKVIAETDLTGAQIKALYEAEANAFTDAKDTKLTSIETNAKDDQNASEVPTVIQNGVTQVNVQLELEQIHSDLGTIGDTDDQNAGEVPVSTYGNHIITETQTSLQNLDDQVITTAERSDLHSHSNKTTLDNTTASYTTAQEPKLSNIETDAKDDQDASEVSTAVQNGVTQADVQAELEQIHTDIGNLALGDADQNADEVPTTIQNGVTQADVQAELEQIHTDISNIPVGTDDQNADEVATTVQNGVTQANVQAELEQIHTDIGGLGGASATPWTAYTPVWVNGGAGAQPSLGNGKAECYWRRVEDSIEVKFSMEFGSTTTFGNTAGYWLFSIPSGLTIDLSKQSSYFAFEGGAFYADLNNRNNNEYGTILLNFNTTQIALSTLLNYTLTPLIPFTWEQDDTISCRFTVPIVEYA